MGLPDLWLEYQDGDQRREEKFHEVRRRFFPGSRKVNMMSDFRIIFVFGEDE
jgi:hypothetical protein